MRVLENGIRYTDSSLNGQLFLYTQLELAELNRQSSEMIEIDGVKKSRYAWTQEQRRIETAVRYQKDRANLARHSGHDDIRRDAQSKINALNNAYDRITEKAGLSLNRDRMYVAGFRQVKTAEELKNPFSTLQNATHDGTIVVTEKRSNHGRVKLKEDPNAVIDVVGKKSSVSRYIYDESGNVRYRVDNNDHGYPKEHAFENGEHYHIAKWNGGKWSGYSTANEIPKQLRKLCADILKEGDDHV